MAVASTGIMLSIAPSSQAATFVSLNTADSFAVLAGSGITNTAATTITGDLGYYPTVTYTGSGSVTLTGSDHAGDSVTQGAKTDLSNAYTSVAAEIPTTVTSAIAAVTLTPGVYHSGSNLTLGGNIVLDAGGNSNAVFIFQAGSTITTASSTNITVINSGQACNVFYSVGSSATLGTGTHLVGNVLAVTSITDNGGAVVSGRLLVAERLSLSRKRLVRSGWLFAILIAATALLSPLSRSHHGISPRTPMAVQSVSAQPQQLTFAKRSVPLRIQIPSLSVNSSIIELGLEKDGTLAVPPDGSIAGWYNESPTPGEIGPAVIVAHVDWKGKEGVFFNLKSIKVGAFVKIVCADGTTQTFKVEKVEAFAKKNYPTNQVYGDIAYAGLRLITCGDFNFQLHKYVKDIVVFAKVVPSV